MKPFSQKESLISFFAVLTAVFLLYGQTLGFGFVWDDHIEVLGNSAFHSWKNFPSFFTVPYWTLMTGGFAPYHRPMIPVMILLVSTFFGKNPLGYHLLNLALYALTSWIYYQFLRQLKLSRWIAIIAAGIFLLHPAHAEAVSWGSARPVLLSGLCFVTCLALSHQTAGAPLRRRFWLLCGLFLVFTVGLLSYHSILTLAPLIFFSDFLNPDSQNKPLSLKITEYTGYAVLGLGFIAYCLILFHKMGETDLRPFYSPAIANVIYTGQPLENLLAPINTLTRYTEILLFPMNLVPDPAFFAAHLSLSAVGTFILFSLISGLLIFQKKHLKYLLFSILWMGCGVLTVANLVPQGGLFADRYAYIASMGFALWAALSLDALKNYLISRSSHGRALWVFLLVLLCFSLGIKTVTYCLIWKNDFGFWLEASILAPRKARTHDKLGILLDQNGHPEEAVKEYQKVLELDPDHFTLTYQRLAAALKKLGRNQEAQTYQEKFEALVKKSQTAPQAASPRTPLLHVSN